MSFLTIFMIALAALALFPDATVEALDWLPLWAQAGGIAVAGVIAWGMIKSVIGVGMFAAMTTLRVKLLALFGGAGASAATYWDTVEAWLAKLGG